MYIHIYREIWRERGRQREWDRKRETSAAVERLDRYHRLRVGELLYRGDASQGSCSTGELVHRGVTPQGS